MIKQDILEKQAKTVYLGIGSNLGNRIKNIEDAKLRLFKNNINISKSSSYYETLSWPNPNHPKFYNIVLEVTTKLNENDLLRICKKIEKSLGRKSSYRNAPRVCDIDILDYNKKSSKININLPHPRLHRRNFVLIPLFEISKKWQHPKNNQKIVNLLSKLDNKNLRTIKFI